MTQALPSGYFVAFVYWEMIYAPITSFILIIRITIILLFKVGLYRATN